MNKNVRKIIDKLEQIIAKSVPRWTPASPVVVEVEHRGPTPDGELRHPVIRGWEIG
jgi:hypothetical protein